MASRAGASAGSDNARSPNNGAKPAAISRAVGALMLAATGALHNVTALPESLLRYVGFLFIPYVLVVGWLGLREAVPRAAVWAVIACNVGWAIASVWLLSSGGVAPSTLGVAFVIVQAVAVVVFAELQFMGLRRSALPV